MAISNSWVAVGTTPVLIVNPGQSAADGTTWVEIHNASANSVYVGGSNVSSSNGRVVASGATWAAPLTISDAIYAASASGSNTVQVLINRQ